jgi:hypothetical protein
MAKKKQGVSKTELHALHLKLKESMKRTALHVERQKRLYAQELADYERLYGKYVEDES